MYCKCGNYITKWKTNPDYCSECLRASSWEYYSIVDDGDESFEDITFKLVTDDETY